MSMSAFSASLGQGGNTQVVSASPQNTVAQQGGRVTSNPQNAYRDEMSRRLYGDYRSQTG